MFSGKLGVGEFNTHFITDVEVIYFNKALLITFIVILIYNITMHYVVFAKSSEQFNNKNSLLRNISSSIQVKHLNLLVFLSIIISLIAFSHFINKAGGIIALFNALSLRNVFLKGEGYILLLTNLAKLVLFLLTVKLLSLSTITKKQKTMWITLFLLSIILIMMTGGRSTILYGIVVLIIIRHYLYKKIRVTKAASFGIVLFFVVIVLYRIVLRDVHFAANAGKSIYELITNAIYDFPNYFFGGYDVIQFDALMVILQNIKSSSNFLYGQTIKAAFLSPIPSSIYPDKEYGAMSYFTKNFFPDFYYPNKVELNTSLVGDLYLNMGILGVIIGIFIFSLILGYFYRKLTTSSNSIYLIIYSITIVRIISLIRGDFFNFYTFYMQDIIPITLMYLFLRIMSSYQEKLNKRSPLVCNKLETLK
jgi:oligosaccharide repeat unit polymerase